MNTFITILGLLPTIFSVIKEAITAILAAETFFEQKAKAKALADAIKTAHDTKDTSKLENLFNPPSHPPTAA